MYALLQLNKANGNTYYARTKVLPQRELSSSLLNEWVAKEGQICAECVRRAQGGALQRCRMGDASRNTLFKQLEAAIITWLHEQFEKNLKPHPNVLWNRVETIVANMGIDTEKHLKGNWWRQFKQRNNIYCRC